MHHVLQYHSLEEMTQLFNLGLSADQQRLAMIKHTFSWTYQDCKRWKELSCHFWTLLELKLFQGRLLKRLFGVSFPCLSTPPRWMNSSSFVWKVSSWRVTLSKSLDSPRNATCIWPAIHPDSCSNLLCLLLLHKSTTTPGIRSKESGSNLLALWHDTPAEHVSFSILIPHLPKIPHHSIEVYLCLFKFLFTIRGFIFIYIHILFTDPSCRVIKLREKNISEECRDLKSIHLQVSSKSLLNAKRAALGLSAGFICPAFLILGKKHRPETVQTVVENTTTCFEFYRDTAHEFW